MTDNAKIREGCACCGRFPVTLSSVCHPKVPFRVFLESPTQLVLVCATCAKEVARFTVNQERLHS